MGWFYFPSFLNVIWGDVIFKKSMIWLAEKVWWPSKKEEERERETERTGDDDHVHMQKLWQREKDQGTSPLCQVWFWNGKRHRERARFSEALNGETKNRGFGVPFGICFYLGKGWRTGFSSHLVDFLKFFPLLVGISLLEKLTIVVNL